LRQRLAQALEKTIRAHRACLQEQPEPDSEAQDDNRLVAFIERPETLDSYGKERPLAERTHER
jgi:hypothetical protein